MMNHAKAALDRLDAEAKHEENWVLVTMKFEDVRTGRVYQEVSRVVSRKAGTPFPTAWLVEARAACVDSLQNAIRLAETNDG